MTRWLVTGAAGMLGRDLTALLTARDEEFTALARADLDLTDAGAVAAAVSSVKPDVVVNCAAWTAVDAAEEHEAQALAVNGHGAGNLAAACASAGALLVHPSTDYVFDGRARAPYAEGRADRPRRRVRPHQAGRRAGGARRPAGRELRRPYRLAVRRPRQELRQDDAPPGRERHRPRCGRRPARPAHLDGRRRGAGLRADRDDGPPGVYHATSSGQTTWFGFAEEIFALYQDQGQNQGQTKMRIQNECG